MRLASTITLALAALQFNARPLHAEPDALERPAVITPRAASSVVLAVTRAGSRLVAVGEHGIILLSDDNGRSWKQTRVPVSTSLTNVAFPTEKTGWAIGHSGVVLKTSDRGETWVKQLDGSKVAQLILEAAKAEGTQGQKLADAERLVADGPDKPFLDVHFWSETEGIVVGAYGLILATQDGGASWRSLVGSLDNPKGKHLYSVSRIHEGLLVVGEQGAAFLSNDGGKTFRNLKTPYTGTYFGTAASASEGFVVFGLRGNAYCSLDGGVSWKKVDTGAPVTLTAGMRLPDDSLALVDEGGRLLRGGCKRGFAFLSTPNPYPYTAITEASDGALILAGARGLTRYVPTKAISASR